MGNAIWAISKSHLHIPQPSRGIYDIYADGFFGLLAKQIFILVAREVFQGKRGKERKSKCVSERERNRNRDRER